MTDKFISNPDDKLEDALALLAAGFSLTEVLAEAGNDAEWLRPLLEVADQVGDLQTTILIPPPEASLRRMLDYGQELAATSSPTSPDSSNWRQVWGWLGGGWLPRLATGLVTALLVIAFLGGTVMVLAQRSLPGQPLYGLKRAGESLRLNLTENPAERERLHETYNQLRQQETTMLLEQGQAAQVAFEGRIEALSDTTVNLEGLTVQLTPQTEIKGQLAVGARVQMEGLTQPPDKIVTLTMTVIEAPPPPSPTPTSTPTPTPGQSQTRDMLTLPTATATSTPGLSKATDTLRLPTATPTQTATPRPPSPTATPTVAVLEPPPVAPPPAGDDSSNTNDSGNEDRGDSNDNSQNNGGDGNANNNENSGDDHSGPGGGSDNTADSGGDNNSGGGGGGDSGSSDNSESSSSGDDHSGKGSDDSGDDG